MMIIDGYNLLFTLTRGARAGLDVERERNRLLALLAQSLKGRKVVVVFDGSIYRDVLPIGDSQRRGELNLIFTRDESADDRIVRMVEKERDRKGITVVTSDRQIRNAVEKMGSATVPSEKFARLVGASASPAGDEERPSRRKEDGITDAEADGWMKLFGLNE